MKYLVSLEDEDLLKSCYIWKQKYVFKKFYSPKKTKKLHRVIMERILKRELLRTELVDHIDGNGLNNKRENLRLATNIQNNQNRHNRKGKSRFKGVYLHSRGNKWIASIRVNTKRIYLGSFENELDAAIAYNNAAEEYFKEFAHLNNV